MATSRGHPRKVVRNECSAIIDAWTFSFYIRRDALPCLLVSMATSRGHPRKVVRNECSAIIDELDFYAFTLEEMLSLVC